MCDSLGVPELELITDNAAALQRCGDLFRRDPVGSNMLASVLSPTREMTVIRVSHGADTIGAAVVIGDSCELGPVTDEVIPAIAAEVPDSVTNVRGAAGPASAVAGILSEQRGTAVLDPVLYRSYHTAEVTEPSKRRKGKAFESDRDRRAQAIEWNTAFGHDTGLVQSPDATDDQVDSALNEHRLIEWRTKGEVVAQLMITAARFGVVRIDMVYTAPEHRNRGHSAAFVAAVA